MRGATKMISSADSRISPNSSIRKSALLRRMSPERRLSTTVAWTSTPGTESVKS